MHFGAEGLGVERLGQIGRRPRAFRDGQGLLEGVARDQRVRVARRGIAVALGLVVVAGVASQYRYLAPSYFAIAVLACFFLWLSWHGLTALKHFRNPSTHPVIKRVKRWGQSPRLTVDDLARLAGGHCKLHADPRARLGGRLDGNRRGADPLCHQARVDSNCRSGLARPPHRHVTGRLAPVTHRRCAAWAQLG